MVWCGVVWCGVVWCGVFSSCIQMHWSKMCSGGPASLWRRCEMFSCRLAQVDWLGQQHSTSTLCRLPRPASTTNTPSLAVCLACATHVVPMMPALLAPLAPALNRCALCARCTGHGAAGADPQEAVRGWGADAVVPAVVDMVLHGGCKSGSINPTELKPGSCIKPHALLTSYVPAACALLRCCAARRSGRSALSRRALTALRRPARTTSGAGVLAVVGCLRQTAAEPVDRIARRVQGLLWSKLLACQRVCV